MDDLVAWLTQILDEDVARLSGPTFCGPVWPTTDQMLARIAADREILTLGICVACDVEDQPCDHRESTLRLLASVHADRPGYREEWKP